jgi:hypothetical protein
VFATREGTSCGVRTGRVFAAYLMHLPGLRRSRFAAAAFEMARMLQKQFLITYHLTYFLSTGMISISMRKSDSGLDPHMAPY